MDYKPEYKPDYKSLLDENCMTFQKLENILKEHKIPSDVRIIIDSGSEMDPTGIDGVYYHKEDNVIAFTGILCDREYAEEYGWESLLTIRLRLLRRLP